MHDLKRIWNECLSASVLFQGEGSLKCSSLVAYCSEDTGQSLLNSYHKLTLHVLNTVTAIRGSTLYHKVTTKLLYFCCVVTSEYGCHWQTMDTVGHKTNIHIFHSAFGIKPFWQWKKLPTACTDICFLKYPHTVLTNILPFTNLLFLGNNLHTFKINLVQMCALIVQDNCFQYLKKNICIGERYY